MAERTVSREAEDYELFPEDCVRMWFLERVSDDSSG